MDVTSNKKQYILVFVFTAMAVMIYLICHRFELSQPVMFDGGRAVDNFIRAAVVDGSIAQKGLLDVCEYNLQNMMMFLLIRVCGDAWTGINIYYILTFFMISFSMYHFLSRLELPAEVSVGLAVVAAFVPFHVDRGEGQMMTSNFFLVPLLLEMFYDLAYCRTTEPDSKGYLVIVCMAPFIDVRLSVMAAILFIVIMLQCRDWSFAKYLMPLLVLTGLVGYISSTLQISDIEMAKGEGMRILDLILPMRYHIVGKLADKRTDIDVLLSAHGESGLNSLGVLFSVGFVAMMLGLFFEWKFDRRIAWMGMISMVVILIAGICGVGSVIEYFGVKVTYWNRMAVFITVCSVAVTGVIAGHCSKYIERRFGNKVLMAGWACMYAVFIVGFFEQILRGNM